MPKYLSDKDANLMRVSGKAKHLPDESRRIEKEGPDEHAETHKATVRVLGKLAATQETLAGVIADTRSETTAALERIGKGITAAIKAVQPPTIPERARRWDFTIERDADGRIKKVVAKA
jgi:hypothetical protein